MYCESVTREFPADDNETSCVNERAYAESVLPVPMAGRPWAMAELTRRVLCWHGTSRRHLQEMDEPNQTLLLFLNGGSIKLPQARSRRALMTRQSPTSNDPEERNKMVGYQYSFSFLTIQ